jgi:hypothetical protein
MERVAKRTLIGKSGAVEIPKEAAAIMERHKTEMAEITQRHERELTDVRKLISAIAVMDGIDPELSAPLRERLAAIK